MAPVEGLGLVEELGGLPKQLVDHLLDRLVLPDRRVPDHLDLRLRCRALSVFGDLSV